LRARQLRADFTFGEQIIDIADDSRNDWLTAKNGRLIPNKELVLRSKIRIAARQLHMSRLQPQTWGDKLTVGIKNDENLLSEDERRRRAEELISMIRELREPPPGPPPLVYRWEEAPEEAEPGGSADEGRGITTVTPRMLREDSARSLLAGGDRPGRVEKVPGQPPPTFSSRVRHLGPLHLCRADHVRARGG